MALPDPIKEPCRECPWRKHSAPGWLGPHSAQEWIDAAHSDDPIACHLTIKESGSWEGARQCRGVANYRANTCKSPRNPEVIVGHRDERIFPHQMAFLEHHERTA